MTVEILLVNIVRILFLFWIARKILYYTYLWQLKEYRFDRFLIHLKETEQGRDLLFSRSSLIKWFLILLYPSLSLSGSLTTVYPYLVFAVFLSDSYKTLLEIPTHSLRKPILTLKAIAIIVLSFIFISIVVSFPLTDIYIWLLLVDKIAPLFIAYLVFFFSIPTEFYYDHQVLQASDKIRRRKKKLTVIGITGSYGKSSTKEFIAHVLSKKFSVLKTKGTSNTRIGIANTILKDLRDEHEVFVVEMGAYKIGEISALCQIVKPSIGVLTAVNYQHNSLFGSLENTIRAKYELIESLPKNGIALFNGNNVNAQLLYEKTDKKKYLYCVEGKKNISCDIVVKNISVKQQTLTFNALLNREAVPITTHLLGRHNIENLLPAILIGRIFGIHKKVIQEALWEIYPLPLTMQLVIKKSGGTFIDDTFNANPQALSAGLDYLKAYRKKKLLVLQPMIELGKYAENEHYLAGQAAGEVCDYIFLTNKNFSKSFIKGVREKNKKTFVTVLSANETKEQIVNLVGKADVVLFEGKEAGLVLKMIERN